MRSDPPLLPRLPVRSRVKTAMCRLLGLPTAWIPVGLLLGAVAPAQAQSAWLGLQEQKLFASDATAYADFGIAVALLDDVLLVGNPDNSNLGSNVESAYVYRLQDGTWNEEAILSPSLGTSNFGGFGESVALEDGLAVVGAPSFPTDRVYVYEFDGGAWTESAILAPVDPTDSETFGASVAVQGERIVVGATNGSIGAVTPGVVYVFDRVGGTWSQTARLQSSDAEQSDAFGNSVALDQDTLVVGAFQDDDNGEDTGSAYVFTYDGYTWSEEAKLVPGTAVQNDTVGLDVAIEGDIAVVGAPKLREIGPGSVTVYERSGGTWTETQTLVFPASTVNDIFGYGVEISDETIVVNSTGKNAGGGQGVVLVFERTGATWTQVQEIVPLDATWSGSFGEAIAWDGVRVAMGNRGDSDAGLTAGAAHIFQVGRVNTPAKLTPRTHPANPSSYSAAPAPSFGTTVTAQVDLAGTTGHDFALVTGYLAALTLPLPGGQALLVDPTEASGELLGLLTQPGPVASFSLPITLDLSLDGLVVHTQAIHFGGVVPFALSNAVDYTLGF